MNLTEVVNDPDFAESFVVLRSQGGSFSAGGWKEPPPQRLNYYGVISIATAKEIESLPEADRVHEAIVINCELPLYVTRIANEGTTGSGTSDVIIWVGGTNDKYRIMKVHNYSTRGYWWAIAVRMVGA